MSVILRIISRTIPAFRQWASPPLFERGKHLFAGHLVARDCDPAHTGQMRSGLASFGVASGIPPDTAVRHLRLQQLLGEAGIIDVNTSAAPRCTQENSVRRILHI